MLSLPRKQLPPQRSEHFVTSIWRLKAVLNKAASAAVWQSAAGRKDHLTHLQSHMTIKVLLSITTGHTTISLPAVSLCIERKTNQHFRVLTKQTGSAGDLRLLISFRQNTLQHLFPWLAGEIQRQTAPQVTLVRCKHQYFRDLCESMCACLLCIEDIHTLEVNIELRIEFFFPTADSADSIKKWIML